MKIQRHRLARAMLVPIVTTLLAAPGLQAQQPGAAPPAQAAPAAAKFSQQELDTLIAPIALYPDALVAQVLMAAAYPLEIVQAAQWQKANPALKDKALEDALLKQPWEPAVKSLTSVPQVLQQMSDKLDWTQKLGEAVVAQQAEVLKTVQSLRAKAAAAGNLKSSPEQVVKTEVVESHTVYIIESAKPTVVYVPTYNPYTVYGTWWYPAPPYYMYPPAYVYPPGVAFATGVVVGAAIWGNTNWHGNSVTVNVNQYNSYNKTNISSSSYTYNSAKVNTANVNTANVNQANVNQATKSSAQSQAQAQGMSASSAQSKAQAQGTSASSAQSKAQAQGMSTSSAQSKAQAQGMSTSSAQSKAASSGLSGAGTGSGAATREASARGGASRASAGGGGGGKRR